MNAFAKYTFLTAAAFVLLGSTVLEAQTGDRGYYNQANKLFREKDYFGAGQCYMKYLASEKRARSNGMPFAVEKKIKGKNNLDPHEEAVYHLAECYRLTNDYAHAEKWYKEATAFSPKAYPACQYWYAVTLRANQKYEEALAAITKFLDSYTTLDDLLMSADRELDDLKYIQSQLVKKDKDRFILVPQQDSGATSAYAMSVIDGDTLAFTAIHVRHADVKDGGDIYYNALYTSVDDADLMAQASPMSLPQENDGMQNGLASFSRDGKKMFFTKWTKKDGRNNSAIYLSYRKGGSWSEPVKLPEPVNVEGYNSAQPFITENGYLLFTSDRPGGMGNYDLWYAMLDSNAEPLSVENMGNIINTAGDDESPFYHQQSGTLVFSSNGRPGMGGFDIYYASNEFNFTRWTKPVNPGFPINSPRDDQYFISTDEDNLWNSGWLSSDRSSGCCLALFSVRENNRQIVSGSVVDCRTQKPLVGANLQVTDPKHAGKLLGHFTTDSLGRYNFELKNASRFDVLAERDGYTSSKNTYVVHFEGLTDTVNNETVCLSPLAAPNAADELQEKLKALSRSHTVANFAYKKSTLPHAAFDNLDSLADLMKQNPGIIIQVEGYTDGIGGDAYNRRLAKARVDACIRYLVAKGISAKRLRGKAFGKCCPIAPETINGKDNPAGREINRRVEYKLLTE